MIRDLTVAEMKQIMKQIRERKEMERKGSKKDIIKRAEDMTRRWKKGLL